MTHVSPPTRSRSWYLRDSIVNLVVVVSTVAVIASEEFPPYADIFYGIDIACVALFIVEAAAKIRSMGFATYWRSKWNRFDFIVTVISAPVLLTPFIALPGAHAVAVMRIGRIFRLFRMLRFIPNVDHLILGVQRALRASLGVFLALFLVQVILSVLSCYLFRDYAPDYFGTPLRATWSMFRVFTIEGWYEVPDAIGAHPDAGMIGPFARVFFMASVLFGGILGLSLANAVFVDEMTMDNTHALETKVDALHQEIVALRLDLAASRNTADTDDLPPLP